jgi:nucleoside-diphosphate-sugar epimerase
MKVLITGSSGLIGSALKNSLEALQIEVVGHDIKMEPNHSDEVVAKLKVLSIFGFFLTSEVIIWPLATFFKLHLSAPHQEQILLKSLMGFYPVKRMRGYFYSTLTNPNISIVQNVFLL